MRRFVSWVNGLLTVVVLAAALAAVLSLGGSQDPRLDLLSHLAPLYGAVGLAGAVWAIVAGRGPIVAASVLAIVASAYLVVPEFSRGTGPAAPPDAPGQIKVIQLNALTRNTDIGRVAAWLTAQKPDIVTVSEARHDLRDLMVRRGWKTAGARGSLMIFTPVRYKAMDRPRPPGGAVLTFVNATYANPSGDLEVFTTHLDRDLRAVSRRQHRGLETILAHRPTERMILTGDFNATPWSAQLRRLDRDLGLIRRDRATPTWPAQAFGHRWPLPFLPIDHIYAGPGWATVKVERGPWLGSDHYPLIVTLAPVARR